MAVTEAELEEGTYERLSAADLPATRRTAFERAVDGEYPTIADENVDDWYHVVSDRGHTYRVQLAIQYRDQWYEIEVHHVDHC